MPCGLYSWQLHKSRIYPLLWDAQFAATVQVREASPEVDEMFSDWTEEVDEMFSDWTEAPLLPSVCEACQEVDEMFSDRTEVCEGCQEVDEMFSDRTEARLLPSVCEACQEVDEMFSDWTEARYVKLVRKLRCSAIGQRYVKLLRSWRNVQRLDRGM
eukprot:s3505_g3.t1